MLQGLEQLKKCLCMIRGKEELSMGGGGGGRWQRYSRNVSVVTLRLYCSCGFCNIRQMRNIRPTVFVIKNKNANKEIYYEKE
jgi:hypothetical protein